LQRTMKTFILYSTYEYSQWYHLSNLSFLKCTQMNYSGQQEEIVSKKEKLPNKRKASLPIIY
jgi:hypothetical protein